MDLSHKGEDTPDVTDLKAGVLHHLQQQMRHALGQYYCCCIQDNLIVDQMTETNSSERVLTFLFL